MSEPMNADDLGWLERRAIAFRGLDYDESSRLIDEVRRLQGLSKRLEVVKYRVRDGASHYDYHRWVYIEGRMQRDASTLWAVTRLGDVLSKSSGEFEFEMQPSSRTDEWLADTRFATVEEALSAYDSWALSGAPHER